MAICIIKIQTKHITVWSIYPESERICCAAPVQIHVVRIDVGAYDLAVPVGLFLCNIVIDPPDMKLILRMTLY